jgi:DNA processing protein
MQAYTLVDNKYPKKLHELYDPPLALFVRGNFEPSRSIIAVVGSRKSSPYAEAQTQQLGRYLAQQAESATISGLAYGIDHTIHQTSLREHGVTYAVLASGINPANISPVAHRAIAEQIIQSNGALLSEYPPGFPADRYTFPARNRIIAALSDATCIMEAAKKSGSLITAQCAIDLHRSVFALPHNNTHPGGTGCNMLIRDGATPLLSPEDLNPFLKHCPQQRTQQQPLDVISQYIKTHPCCTIDDLISEKILSPDTAQIEITKRELSGTITRTPSGLLQLCS